MPEQHDDNSNHIVISPAIFVTLLSSALLSGAGGMGLLGPQLEKEAIKACFDNSRIALDVTAQHGQENIDLKKFVISQTMYRYTTEDAAKDKREIIQRLEAHERRMTAHERHIDDDKIHGGR